MFVAPRVSNLANVMAQQVAANSFRTLFMPMPGSTMVTVMDVRDREFMLRTAPSKFPKNLPEDDGSFEKVFGELLGRGIFAVDGEEWLDHRKIVRCGTRLSLGHTNKGLTLLLPCVPVNCL